VRTDEYACRPAARLAASCLRRARTEPVETSDISKGELIDVASRGSSCSVVCYAKGECNDDNDEGRRKLLPQVEQLLFTLEIQRP
jgi:hypothetical protein